MNKEAYVSFKIAELLKDKGFNWECRSFYEYFSSMITMYQGMLPELSEAARNYNKEEYKDICSRPTQQMACSWLRERGVHIMPTIGCDVDRTPRIFYGAVIALFNDYGDIDYRDPLDESGYNEPEDAIEAALEYCLTNLI